VMTRVLPEPAPARISNGPSTASTAARCSGFRLSASCCKGQVRAGRFLGLVYRSGGRESIVLAQQCPSSAPAVSCYATVDESVTAEWAVIRDLGRISLSLRHKCRSNRLGVSNFGVAENDCMRLQHAMPVSLFQSLKTLRMATSSFPISARQHIQSRIGGQQSPAGPGSRADSGASAEATSCHKPPPKRKEGCL